MRRLVVWLLLLAVIWVAVWFGATALLRARFEASLAQARAQGWDVTAGPSERAGFPFVAAIEVSDAVAGGGAALPGAGRVVARRFVLAVALAHPLTLRMTVPEGFTVERAGLPPVSVHAAALVGTAPLFGAPSLTIVGRDLAVSTPAGAEVTAAEGRVVLAPRRPDLGLDLSALGLHLPGAWALGADVARLGLRGEAAGALGAPPANGVQGLVGWLWDWQRRGGRLTLDDAVLAWGTLAVAGHGTLALDAALQPDATLALHIEGYDGALAALVRAGDMARGPALAARFALGLLAHGGKPGIDVSATLHGGQLSVGGVSLGRVPAIVWPNGP